MTPEQLSSLEDHMSDALWRLCNLYTIINKKGEQQVFSLNWAQKRLYRNMWYNNIVLKARQLGISTFICMFFLDVCLFHPNVSAGIIAHTREDAEHMFKRIKFAYDQLPEPIKSVRSATVDSARELVFNNHSSLRVGTSMRGSTLQYLHISEFGKICAHFPDKAREIVTGSLNTLGRGQYVFIESTAEGKEGYFYEICKQAERHQIQGKKLTSLDYQFHFFPWWQCAEYKLNEKVFIPKETTAYFDTLYQQDIDLSDEQKSWYYKKALTQKDDMKREFPSTSQESWESSIDGSFYSRWMLECRHEGRIGNVPWDKQSRVCLAFDPGYHDSCAVVFWQNIGQEIHVIDYYESSGEGLAHYLGVIKAKPYVYDRMFGPHDIESHHFSTGLSTKEVASSLGVNLITLKTLAIRLEDGIEAVRGLFPRFWIDEQKCGRLIQCLDNYKKEYDTKHGMYKSRPLHDSFSNGADSFRYLSVAIKQHIDSDKSGISDSEADALFYKYNPLFK